MKGILAVSDVPLVSRDFALTDVSTTIDSSLTMVMVRSCPAALILCARRALHFIECQKVPMARQYLQWLRSC
jgi:hypothetical protein